MSIKKGIAVLNDIAEKELGSLEKPDVKKIAKKSLNKLSKPVKKKAKVKSKLKVNKAGNIVNYKQRRDAEYVNLLKQRGLKVKPQIVRDFGHDRHSQNALCAYKIAQYLFVNKGLTRFNARQAHDVVVEFGGVNLSQVYKGHYPDSPLHQGFHAISKNETKEVKGTKGGEPQDSFARGERALILKDKRVGIAIEDGYYHPNPSIEYQKIDLPDLKGKINNMIERFK